MHERVRVRQPAVRAFTGHTHASGATGNGLRHTFLIPTVIRKGQILTDHCIKVIVFRLLKRKHLLFVVCDIRTVAVKFLLGYFGDFFSECFSHPVGQSYALRVNYSFQFSGGVTAVLM